MRKFTEDKTYYSDEEIMDLEDKIYYGSDSSGASDDNYQAIMGEDQPPTFKSDTSSEYLVNRDEMYDSEEGEDEMEEGEFEVEEELAFDEEEKVPDRTDNEDEMNTS